MGNQPKDGLKMALVFGMVIPLLALCIAGPAMVLILLFQYFVGA